jgi:hypothetical protein
MAFFLNEQCFKDNDKLTSKIKAKIYLISMICVDDGVQLCAYIN